MLFPPSAAPVVLQVHVAPCPASENPHFRGLSCNLLFSYSAEAFAWRHDGTTESPVLSSSVPGRVPRMDCWCGMAGCWTFHSRLVANRAQGVAGGDLLQLHLHIPGQPKPLSVRLATIRWANESRLGSIPFSWMPTINPSERFRQCAFSVASFNHDRREQIVILDAG